VSKDPVTAYISLGSNLGDRAGNLLLGIRGLLEASFDVTKLSGVYETDPVDMPGAPHFLNMAVEVKVDQISPTQMMARMLRIEYLLGRKEKSQKVPRTIDLDLLFYGTTCLETPFLTLPHPRLHLRNFVLVPLSEIASDFVHPTLGLDISTILSETPDNSRVVRWQPSSLNGIEPDPKPLDLGPPKVYS
jgi:2-amino-4-hydroxy-6-hydroxymethyldihydropteridine diphosphokinase